MNTHELHDQLRTAGAAGLDSFLDFVLEEALRRVGAVQGSLMLFNAREGVLEIIKERDPVTVPKRKHLRFAVGEGIAGKVAETGHPYVSPDVTLDPQFKKPLGEFNFRSLLAVPIVRDRRVLGVICIDSPEPGKFGDGDAAALLDLCSNTADAIDQLAVDHFVEHIKRLRQIESLYAVGQELSGAAFESPDELSNLLKHIVKRAQRVLRMDLITLYQYYQREDRFDTPPSLSGGFYHPEWMVGPVKRGDVPYQIIKGKKSHYSENVHSDLLWRSGQVIAAGDGLPERPSFTDRERVKSAAGILLKAGKEVVGVMFIASRTPRLFSDEEKRVIETFAAYAALAIQGARRFVQSVKEQRAAMQRTSESLTHRLRNVLPVISDRLAKTLEREAATGDGIDWCRMALVEARKAQKIVKEFVKFSRAERFECPDLFTGLELIQKLEDTVKGNLTQEGAQVDVVGEADLPRLKVNFEHLSDDFIGFLRDSERHRPSGLRITISAEVASDRDVKSAGLTSDKAYLKLIYTDNGPGVPADLKQKIFEPFYTTSGGSGLGLAIVEHNAKVHGGTVIECGEPGKGVRFEFYLPTLKAGETGEGT